VSQQPFSLLMLDVDLFKGVDGMLGRYAGMESLLD